MDVDTLADEAARLTVAEQHALLDRIVDALTGAAERSVAEGWDQEIARRIEALDSGTAAPIPWSEVKRRLHDRRDSR